MKDAFAYHDIARQVLDGNWGLAVGSTLVAAVLGGTLSIGAAGGGGHGDCPIGPSARFYAGDRGPGCSSYIS